MADDRDPIGELLGRLERPVAPPARFKDDLKRRLLSELARGERPRPEDAPVSTLSLPIDAGSIPLPALPPRPGPSRKPAPRWWPALEILAAAALVLTILGGYLAGSGHLPALLGLRQDGFGTGATGTYLGDAARSGEQPGPGPEGSPVLSWCVPRAIGIGLSPYAPVVADGLVVLSGSTFGHDDRSTATRGDIVAYDAGTGAERWRINVGRGASIPAVAGGAIFVGTEIDRGPASPTAETALPGRWPAGALVALDAATGKERWRLATEASIDSPPAVADDIVYARANDGQVLAVDAASGRARWRSAATAGAGGGPVPTLAAPAVTDGLVYVADAGILLALDKTTGEERWRATTDGTLPGTPVVADGTVFLIAERFLAETGVSDARLHAFDAATGAKRWTSETGIGIPPTFAVGRGYLAVIGGGGRVHVLDADTGRERWTYRSSYNLYAPPAAVGGLLYLPALDGELHALEVATGRERWRVPIGGRYKLLAAPAIVDGVVYLVDAVGTLFAFGDAGASGATPATGSVPAACDGALPTAPAG